MGARRLPRASKNQSWGCISSPMSEAGRHGEWIVDTVLTGNFKANPAGFAYFTSLSNEKTAKLRAEFRWPARR